MNISKLCPSSDVIIFGSLAEYIACECALEYHYEIENSLFVTETSQFSQMKSSLISAVSKIDKEFAQGFFKNKDLNDNQCVALGLAY